MEKTSLPDKDGFLIDALNLQGSFFHQRTIKTIAESKPWEVDQKEFPVKLQIKTGQDNTKIDIVASRFFREGRYVGIFECKKVNTLFRTWVFFPDMKRSAYDYSDLSTLQTFQPSGNRKIAAIIFDSIFSELSGSTGGKPTYRPILGRTCLPNIFSPDERTLPICYDACSIKVDLSSNKPITHKPFEATDKNEIEKACLQVLLGSRGYAENEYSVIPKNEIALEPLDYYSVFIPIVVTSADLVVCNTDADNIDINGAIINKQLVNFVDEKWLIYNYRPSDNALQSKNRKFFESVADLRKSFDYVSSIFFVNSKHLKEFLEKFPTYTY